MRVRIAITSFLAVCPWFNGVANGGSPCTAQEQATLTAADATENDNFGSSVAISGDTVVVGAYKDNHAGTGSGSAYIFTLSGGVWTQQAKLIASDTAANQHFGVSVAISGNTVVVGAWIDDPSGVIDAGSAYVFVRSGAIWTQQQKLTASDADVADAFGWSVAVSGDTALVGARSAEVDYEGEEVIDAGAAYIFTRAGGVWAQQQILTNPAPELHDGFGSSVVVAGDTAVLGAHGDHPAGLMDAGSAYVFTRLGGLWTLQATLNASDMTANDSFGWSVALSGNTALIGAYTDDPALGFPGAGSAYVFVRSGGVWMQQAKLNASDMTEGDDFGYSVGLSGDMAVVGALRNDHGALEDNPGSAYVFVKPPGGWTNMTETAKLIASDAADEDYFGHSVALAGDTALIGAWEADHAGGEDAGSVYVFDLTGCDSPCIGDLDGGGAVSGIDLAVLLGQWTGATTYAPCPPYTPADLNDDCKVNGLDLAMLLGGWGPCP